LHKSRRKGGVYVKSGKFVFCVRVRYAVVHTQGWGLCQVRQVCVLYKSMVCCGSHTRMRFMSNQASLCFVHE